TTLFRSRLAADGRTLDLAAIPADGSLVPAGDHRPVPVHCDLPTALAAHAAPDAPAEEPREWQSDDWTLAVRRPEPAVRHA
ncbi:hypothetical protein R6L23_16830, partial [Streptomyces sp. SR27]|nr:hypothetical protein [Streptomyces sp. SR27]